MSSPSIESIKFHYEGVRFNFKKRNRLKAFLLKLFKTEGEKVDHINYIFCDDAYLLNLNVQHLRHKTYTDIITFQLSKPGAPLLADIFISLPRVIDNAQKFKEPFITELHRVVFHGALHLCGYKDKVSSDRKLIRKKEDFYLNKYFVSRETGRIEL
jgi:rRNA maturation RNase YbeY